MTSVIRQLSMKRGNYPNHPLFRITPILDKGFQTVHFDPYERVLVAKLHANRYVPDLWDCNGLYLDYHDRLDAPADAQVRAVKSRYKLTREQLAEYRTSPWITEQERARRQAERAEREAAEATFAEQRRIEAEERERFTREYAEREAKRKAERERQQQDWDRVGAETQQWLTEMTWIMARPGSARGV